VANKICIHWHTRGATPERKKWCPLKLNSVFLL